MVLKLTKIEQLKPGVRLARPVVKDGKILFERNTVLKLEHIDMLKKWKIPYVLVDEPLKVADEAPKEDVTWELPFEGEEAPKPVILNEEELKNWEPPISEPDFSKPVEPKIGYVKVPRPAGPAQQVFLESYRQGLQLVKNSFQKLRAGESPSVEILQRWVSQKFDEFLENPLVALQTKEFTPDNYLLSHSINVCILTVMIGFKLGWDADKIVEAGIAALLHDVGMVKVENQIWNKPGDLSQKDIFLIRKHPIYGMDAIIEARLDEIFGWVAYQHHERLDGSGYPKGREGIFSTLEYSRVVAVADTFEALTSPRNWRQPLPLERVASYLISNKDMLFDPKPVDALIDSLDDLNLIDKASIEASTSASILMLVTDDFVRRKISYILGGVGYYVMETQTIDQMTQLLETNPNMIIIEHTKYGAYSSLEIARMLRVHKSFPPNRPIILLVTGKISKEEVVSAIKNGVSWILVYPLPEDVFIKKVDEVFEKFFRNPK